MEVTGEAAGRPTRPVLRMATSTPRLYMSDERGPVRRALAERLSRVGSVTVVGDAAEPAQAIEAIRTDPIDIVLIEIKRSDGLGLELVRQITAPPPRSLCGTSWRRRARLRQFPPLESPALPGDIHSFRLSPTPHPLPPPPM